MEKKTAITEFLEWGSKLNAGYIHIDLFNAKANELLETEKNQIVDAYREGGINFDLDKGRSDPRPEQYFTQTYQTKTPTS